MKQFLAVFTGHPDAFQSWQKLDDATRAAREQEGIQAWGDWSARHAAITVVEGGPLGKTKRITGAGVADTRNNLAAFVVIKAESHDAAAQLFENHPHFSIFPGDGVEVMEIMPIPGGPQ